MRKKEMASGKTEVYKSPQYNAVLHCWTVYMLQTSQQYCLGNHKSKDARMYNQSNTAHTPPGTSRHALKPLPTRAGET